MRRVIRDISEEPEGSGVEDDARALELQSENGKISEIVLTQVNTSDGEGKSLHLFFPLYIYRRLDVFLPRGNNRSYHRRHRRHWSHRLRAASTSFR